MGSIVFVSHSSKDRKIAATVCSALENRGIKCWISSRDVAPGGNYQESIVTAIRQARAMLLVFSGNANSSPEIMKELALASEYGVAVVPVRAEDVAPTGAFKYELATRQWIDLFDDWETAIGRVADHVGRIGAEPLAALPAAAPPAVKHGRSKLIVGATAAIVLLVGAGGAYLALQRPRETKVPDLRPALMTATSGLTGAASSSAAAPVAAPTITSTPQAASPPPSTELRLRSAATEISIQQIEAMLVQHDFYDAKHNPAGKGVDHQYEARVLGEVVVVVDRATHLMWQKSSVPPEMTYDDAERHIARLNAEKFGGFADWRLPTVEEAMSLMEPKAVNEFHIAPVFSRGAFFIWAGDRAQVRPFGWVIYFLDGEVSREPFTFNASVRAVRASEP